MSKFRLYPVPQSKLECLKDILSARIIETNMQKRSDASECLDKLNDGYEARTMAAYVDSVTDPKCCLIMTHFPSIATRETLAYVSLGYVSPEMRGNGLALDVMLATAENYAKFHQADTLVVTSWLYRGSKDTTNLWLKKGFEIQETILVKHLT